MFSASALQIVIDGSTGAWKRLVDIGTGCTLLESSSGSGFASLTIGGKESPFPIMLRPPGDAGLSGAQAIGRALAVTSHKFTDEGEATVLAVECREGSWVLTVEYRIPRGLRRVGRRFRIRYEGAGEGVLRQLDIKLPVMLARPGYTVEIPDSPFPASMPYKSMPGQKLNPGDSGPGMVALRDPSTNRTLLFSAYSETEAPSISLVGEPDGLRPTYSLMLAGRINQGMEVAWGGDYIWVLDGDGVSELKQFQKFWDEVGARTPEDRPPWTERALIYETQIGAALFDRGSHQFNPYPTVQALIEKLDYIQDLGFNTLQIMPRHPCPSYAIYEYSDPAHQYGDDVGLKTLVQQAHTRGLRVILDWILHGVIDKELARKTSALIGGVSDEKYKRTFLADYVLNFDPAWIESAPEVNALRTKHPDWFMKWENGDLAFIYTWAFDLENRDLQDYIIEAMKFYVREYDVDGFRVDAPSWNQFPNWDRNIPYRASLSATGGIRLLDRARPALHSLKPDLMMYTEPSNPAFRRMFDVNYSYDELTMMEQLLAWNRKSPKWPGWDSAAETEAVGQNPVTAFQFRVWLERRRLSMPRGSVTIHQVDSHDSFWWLPWEYKFRREQFGVEGYRALLFMLATIDGGLMQYPTGEEGSEEFMKRVFALRQLPEISQGSCDYLRVQVSDEAIFAASWEAPSGWAVPLTNFGPRSSNVRVSFPAAQFDWNPSARYLAQDVFNNNPVNREPEAVMRGGDLENLAMYLDSLGSAMLLVRKL